MRLPRLSAPAAVGSPDDLRSADSGPHPEKIAKSSGMAASEDREAARTSSPRKNRIRPLVGLELRDTPAQPFLGELPEVGPQQRGMMCLDI